jgi:hypothetical protein
VHEGAHLVSKGESGDPKKLTGGADSHQFLVEPSQLMHINRDVMTHGE